MEPSWIVEARKHLGLAEIKGPKHNSVIQGWLVKLGAWWSDDETPWCGTFVAQCVKTAGYSLPRHWYRAKGWLDWGMPLKAPTAGCVCVLEREGGGHVFFVLGRSPTGDLVGIGGNQGNRVSIAAFAPARVVGYRWPMGVPPRDQVLPVMAVDGRSMNEG